MVPKARKALLLRVGIDRGTGGALGPIFVDGTFEYIPIPERERTRDRRTYATLLGRQGRSLADYLPRKLAEARPHVDPDFATATYGDAAPRKCGQLSKLNPGDFLVFYCGLTPYPSGDVPRLFVIGYLQVRTIHRIAACDKKTWRGLQHRFGNTAHFLRSKRERELVLVEGERRRSRFLRRALPLGDGRDYLLPDLAPLGYQGSVRRAVGHWVEGEAAVEFLEAWLKEGTKILGEGRPRLFLLPPSAVVRATGGESDVAFDDGDPAPGDWVLIAAEGEPARLWLFARINRCETIGGRRRARSSLFWQFSQCGPLIEDALSSSGSSSKLRTRCAGRQAVIRRLVSWLSHHYRIGRLY